MSRMSTLAKTLALPALAWMVLVLQGCDTLEQVAKAVEGGSSSTNGTAAETAAATSTTGASDGDSTTSAQAAQMKSRAMVKQSSVALSATSWSGGVRLLMEVSPLSADGGRLPAQRLVVDTGSSTLAFCQSSFIQEAAYKPTKYISCNQYNPGGSPTGYWGPFVQGQIFAGNLSFAQAAYSIMAEEESMPCTDGMQGIFGIAFQQLDVAFPADQRPDWASGQTTCPQAAGVVPPPLLQKLNSDGSRGAEKVGIYWSGKLGDNEGMLYLDADAELNEHYRESAMLGPAVLGEVGWYDVSFQKISVGDQDFTNFDCSPNQQGKQCIMDTGTPGLVLPEQLFNYATQLIELGTPGASLTFWLPGVSGEAVPLKFDLALLNSMQALSQGGDGTNIILGLPLWAFYYTVFNIKDQSVSFIRHKTLPSSSPSQPQVDPPTEPQPQPQPQPWQPIPGQAPESPEPSPAQPSSVWPFDPFTGPEPWTEIPGHQAGSWPAPSADPWPADPFAPFGFQERVTPGSGRRMADLPVHV